MYFDNFIIFAKIFMSIRLKKLKRLQTLFVR